jgi:hypothetical protein
MVASQMMPCRLSSSYVFFVYVCRAREHQHAQAERTGRKQASKGVTHIPVLVLDLLGIALGLGHLLALPLQLLGHCSRETRVSRWTSQ